MRNGHVIFVDTYAHLQSCFIRNSIRNSNANAASEETQDLRNKHGRLLVLWDDAFSTFYAKREWFLEHQFDKLATDMELIRRYWTQLNLSIAPRAHATLSHLTAMLHRWNKGLDNVGEEDIGSGYQRNARDYPSACSRLSFWWIKSIKNNHS